MLFSALYFLFGIVLVQFFKTLPDSFEVLSLVMCSALLAGMRLWRLMFLVTGVVWAVGVAQMRLEQNLSAQLENQLWLIDAQIVGLPDWDSKRVRLDVKVLQSPVLLPEKLRLNWYFPDQDIKTGQVWRWTVKLKRPQGTLNPGGFDYERWLLQNQIGATGYIRNQPRPILLQENGSFLNIDRFRQTIIDKLDRMQLQHVGLIKALTVGDKQGLNAEQWQLFRRTGTVHLLAISGLHIGLVAGFIFGLTQKIAIFTGHRLPHRLAAGCAILAALIYSALAGFALPTQRALIMLTVVLLALSWQRHIRVTHGMGLALWVILLLHPLAVLDPGFWLSFLAVFLIAYIFFGRLQRLVGWRAWLRLHLVCAFGMAPVLLFLFGQVSLIAPLANGLAVPLITFFVVPLSLIAVLFSLAKESWAAGLLWPVDESLDILSQLLTWLAGWAGAVYQMPNPELLPVILALMGLFLFLAPYGTPVKRLFWILLLPVFFAPQNNVKVGQLRMTLMDVGQGLSAVLETAHHVMVFDTGAKYSEQFDLGQAVILPFLQNKGINGINTLVISHSDNDHAGGAKSVLNAIPVEQVLISKPVDLQLIDHDFCHTGQRWIWDEVEFLVLSPELGQFDGDNNNSCVIKVNSQQGSVLLTGDIEEPVESWLVQNYAGQLHSQVLIAPHHGSKTSSSESFLKAVNADIILIPAGYQNRFGFPHMTVLERYRKLGLHWMNTATSGAIQVNFTEAGVGLSPYRQQHGRYWHTQF